MNHRERLLDIANEALAQLYAQGLSRAQIARKSGVSQWSLYDWGRRDCSPEPDNVEAVLNLLGRSLGLHILVMRSKAKRIRVKYRSGAEIASVAQSLPEFHCKSLAFATGVSLKAAKAWCLRNRMSLAVVRRESADGHGQRIVWRWVRPEESHGLGYMQGRGAS